MSSAQTPKLSASQAPGSEEGRVTLAAKVAFLGRPGAYPERPQQVEVAETHLSWGVTRLCPAVLPRVGQIGSDGGDASGGRVLDGADEEQQPAQLVVDAAPGIALERLNHVDVLVPHPHQRTDLELAVLETPLLMGADRDFEVVRDPSSVAPIRVR
jgi:hypothetical protein